MLRHLDILAMALVASRHIWTPDERQAYEEAVRLADKWHEAQASW